LKQHTYYLHKKGLLYLLNEQKLDFSHRFTQIYTKIMKKCSYLRKSARHRYPPASQARPALRGFSRGGRARALRAGAQALAGGSVA